EDKSELIAKADTEKKPTFTAKKETTSKQYALQNNKNQNIEKPKKITSPKPKPTVSDRSLKMAKKPAPPSMSNDAEAGDFDAEYAIEEEMEIALDEVNVTAYKNTPPPAPKAASVRASAKFDIANTEDVYAYTRYNTEFQPSHLSNFMPYDGDERLSQSTLKKMPKAIEEVTVGSSKKMKKRGKSKDNIALKRSASKEQLFMQEGVPHIDFLRALEGNWTQYLDSLTYTEKWTMNANNGSLQGVANTSSNGIVAFEENFSISDRNGKLVYIMDFPPKLTYPTVFTQKDENSTSNKKELVFENDRLEFPSKITYRLSTDTMLKITFEGQKEGKSISKSLIMYKE
ncbi:MAG: DUF6265 family protein, partial [Chitinophagales bacterium]